MSWKICIDLTVPINMLSVLAYLLNAFNSCTFVKYIECIGCSVECFECWVFCSMILRVLVVLLHYQNMQVVQSNLKLQTVINSWFFLLYRLMTAGGLTIMTPLSLPFLRCWRSRATLPSWLNITWWAPVAQATRQPAQSPALLLLVQGLELWQRLRPQLLQGDGHGRSGEGSLESDHVSIHWS